MKHSIEHSKSVGKYVCTVLLVLFISEIFTLDIYKTPADPQLVYLNGFVLFAFGAYVVSVHNIWAKSWPILITLSGWGATLLGALRLFFPTLPQAPANTSTHIMLIVLVCVELVAVFKSYQKSTK